MRNKKEWRRNYKNCDAKNTDTKKRDSVDDVYTVGITLIF